MSSSIRHGHNIRVVFPLILAVFFCGLMPSASMAASALRSRVYGFRHIDNKLAIQLANELGIKVTIDMHSSSVVVLTSTDSSELAIAYSLMEIVDRKEPVSLKVLGSISDSEAEETVKQLGKQLGGLNVGTFLDPPTKTVANPLIVDVYQGNLIVLAAAGEMEKAEAAYKAYQAKQKPPSPKAERSEPNQTEPNVPPLAAVKASEPNTAQAVSLAVPQIQPVTPTAEPNEPNAVETKLSLTQLAAAVEEAIEMAAPDEIKLVAEPNQVKPEEPQSQEDFMSSELLKSLAVEEKAAQDTPTAAVETSKTEAVKEAKTETALPAESKTETVEEAKTQAAPPAESKTETVEEVKTETALPTELKTEAVEEAKTQAAPPAESKTETVEEVKTETALPTESKTEAVEEAKTQAAPPAESKTETVEEVKTETALPTESKTETVEEAKTQAAPPAESKTETVEEVKTETALPAESKTEAVEEAKTQAAPPAESKTETVEEVKTETAPPAKSKTEPVKEALVQAERSPDRPALPGTVRIGRIIPAKKAPITQSLQPVDANAVEQPAGEVKEADFKKTIEQLMKQSAEEEKKALQEAATAEAEAAEKPAGAAEETKKIEAATTAVEPPVTQKTPPVETPAEKPAATPTAAAAAAPAKPKDTAAGQKIKTAGTEPTTPQGEEEMELTITLPEKVEIKQLIELVGKQLGLNYIYDETKVKGEVMLKVHDGKIKVKDCYALLETVLRFKGFVMTRRGNLVTIVPSAELPVTDTKIRAAGEPIEPGDVVINSVYPLKHINYNTAQGILRQLTLGTNIIPIAETNTLIITDYSYRMEKIEQVLQILDVPGKPKTYIHRSLQYMQAADLIPRLQKLAAQLENLSITVGTSSGPSMPAAGGVPARIDPRTGQPIGGPQPAAPPQSAAQQAQSVFLEADERTNRILMIGTEEQLKTVNTLIDSLDVRQYNLRYVKEYEIKYVDASEVIDVLNELSLVQIATPQSSGQAGRTAQAAPPRPGMTPQQQQAAQQAAQRAAAATSGGGAESIDQPSVSIRPNTNSLLVNATEEQHEDIQLVIQYIDVEQKDQRTIKEYEIQNVDVQEIVQTLGDLGIISRQSVSNITTSKSSMYAGSSSSGMGTSRTGGMTNRVTGMPMDQGAPEQTAVASLLTAEGGTIKELITTEPQMSILESTNSLLIHATPRQHASIALVIAHVDRELDRISTPYVIYPLENQEPGKLAATLMDLIEGSMSRTSFSPSPEMGPSPGNKIQTEQTGASNLPKKEEERIRIIADDASYSLIVYANKKNQQWVATLIKQLDQYRPQVLLGCTLVEITKDDQFTFDLDLVSRSGGFPAGGSMMQLTAINQGTTTGFPTTRGTFEGTVNKGTGAAFYADDHIQALLNLVDKNNYGRVLARPSLLVKDNEQGVIKAEKTIYVAEEKTVYQTPDQGDAIQTTDIQFKDYKSDITLTITPHITSEKILQLEILLNRTDFDLSSGKTVTVGTKTIPKPYDQITSNVDTWSIIPDGATIILGGIETINQGKTNNKVPILGDLPLVGLLFRGIDQTDKQSRLYVFVKANIIRPADVLTGQSDIERISQRKRQDFEREEAKFQGLQGLPGVKPNPMDPEKILEDDEYIQRLKEQQDQGNIVVVPVN